MNPVLHKRATRDSLTRALEGLPDHLRPIVLAMRDYGIGFMFVPQVADAFRQELHVAAGPDRDAVFKP